MDSKMKLSMKKKQNGFALIEVMIAALVLVVGGVAFMKLQRIGLQYSSNDYARTQAIAISQGFMEQLRSNRGFLKIAGADKNGFIVGGKVSTAAKPQSKGDCKAENPGVVCAKTMLDYHRYITSMQMGMVMKDGNSLLCYRHGNEGQMRLTYLWIDHISDQKNVTLGSANCPANFTDSVASGEFNNSVTIYAQL